MTMRPWLLEELLEWRTRLENLGLPAGDDDFIIPGAAPDGHYTLEQQHNFIRDKSCGRVAAERDPELSFLKKMTPYSLRRGHISLRVLAREGHQAHRRRVRDLYGDNPPALPARAGRAP